MCHTDILIRSPRPSLGTTNATKMPSAYRHSRHKAHGRCSARRSTPSLALSRPQVIRLSRLLPGIDHRRGADQIVAPPTLTSPHHLSALATVRTARAIERLAHTSPPHRPCAGLGINLFRTHLLQPVTVPACPSATLTLLRSCFLPLLGEGRFFIGCFFLNGLGTIERTAQRQQDNRAR